MTDETTTEQLAEIDRDMADIERQVAELVEEAQQADYPQSQPQPVPIQVREGRWRTRNGDIRNVTPTPAYDSRAKRWPWRDAAYDQTWTPNGQNHFNCEESPLDLEEYLGPIEEQLQPEPQAAAIEELRSEVSYVQRLLGESRQRVTHLEELVSNLRTINEAQEKSFVAANRDNNDLRHRLNTVAAELVTQAETSRRLQIELDAAHQVPADSPELRQLRADLEQMTLGRDTYRDGYNRLLSDLETIRETTAADTVEAIVEWLQAFRGCNSPSLALLLIEALPSIMRSLTGLNDEEIE